MAASAGPEEGREGAASTLPPLPGELGIGRALKFTPSTLPVKHSLSKFVLAVVLGIMAVDKAWRA